MSETYNLCIIKPNKSSFSETFIQEHINRLSGNKKVLYGGAFPLYDHNDQLLIKTKFGILSYLIQKKIFKKKDIAIRNKALSNYLKEERIDIVLAEYGMVGSMVASACKCANVPLVIHFHGADAHHRPTIASYLIYYKQAFAYASSIIAVSNDMITALVKLGAPKDKIVLNPYGVNMDLFTEQITEIRFPFFLTIGRFVPKKSPSSVVQAFKLVLEKIPNANLWMVGDGPLLQETKQLAEKLNLQNKIIFTGVLSSVEIASLMNKMCCYVQHSVTAPDGDMEGTPNTILEAAASGLPIVATKHAGIKEAVIDGVTGLLSDEYDFETMAANMIFIAQSPEVALKFGKAGRQHMLAHYDIKNRILLLDRIIKDSIAN